MSKRPREERDGEYSGSFSCQAITVETNETVSRWSQEKLLRLYRDIALRLSHLMNDIEKAKEMLDPSYTRPPLPENLPKKNSMYTSTEVYYSILYAVDNEIQDTDLLAKYVVVRHDFVEALKKFDLLHAEVERKEKLEYLLRNVKLQGRPSLPLVGDNGGGGFR